MDAPLEISVVRPSQLSSGEIALWRQFQQADPALASPYFAPEFSRAVEGVRDDVWIAVLHQRGETAGFFPFQRNRLGMGKPVGGHMSDYHGVIARPETEWTAEQIVRGCGLAMWDFDHVPASQTRFGTHGRLSVASPYLDLSAGYEAYFQSRAQGKSSTVRQVMRRARRMVREQGEIRYVRHAQNPELFRTMLTWKHAQFVRTRVPDVLSMPWTTALLQKIFAAQEDNFRGQLSVLYVGERVAAMDFLLRSPGVLHSWFGHFDQELAKYSPGHILLLKTAADAAAHGIRHLDLGKGAGYKLHFMSGAFPLLEGSVSCRRGLQTVRQLCQGSAALVRASPLRPTARALGTFARPLRNWWAFH